ncbi:uncharacterized protein PADG_06624 [Paracoccidioides brasiliensis Pb18]|uniref:Uncharacterized protein n=1 Tax=Paracoccidioides brasiliensis (strain Pb18) TaxID=502780 RepID=C1GH88_PARBD|nr:uncharacterized protein PADG_06624 [Paracoccidioides brasiliensis Pb18]EEH50545.2 hypothetical protein PADG_06624 [Paracoccidioides brasiliensis Pb18]
MEDDINIDYGLPLELRPLKAWSPSTVFQTCTSKSPKSAYSELPNVVNLSANTQDEFKTAFHNRPISVRSATSTLGTSDYTGYSGFCVMHSDREEETTPCPTPRGKPSLDCVFEILDTNFPWDTDIIIDFFDVSDFPLSISSILQPDLPKEAPLQLDKYDFDEPHNLLPDPLLPLGPCHQVGITNLENDMISEASPANPTFKILSEQKTIAFTKPFLAKSIR